MDVRKPVWHGQLAVSGIGTPFNHSGSIMSIIAESLKDLSQLNPRTLGEGHKEIILRFRDTPFSQSKADTTHDRALDILAEIEVGPLDEGPLGHENLISYRARLCQEGMDYEHASALAAMWFPTPTGE